MSGLEVSKSLIAMEDLACGIGKVTQTRQGMQYSVGRIDVPYAVTSERDIAELDITKFIYARLGEVDYRYDPTFDTGEIKSDFTTKYWRIVNKPLRIYETTSLPDAVTFQGVMLGINDTHGKASPVVYSDGTRWLYMDNTEV